MLNSSRPLRAVNLGHRADCQANTTVPKECGSSSRVGAKVEVNVGTVLIGVGHGALRAQRVSLGRAEVVYHDNDAGPGV